MDDPIRERGHVTDPKGHDAFVKFHRTKNQKMKKGINYPSLSLSQGQKKFYKIKEWNLPGLPKKTEEYKTPLRAASLAAARASDGEDQSLRGHHLPVEKKLKQNLIHKTIKKRDSRESQ